MRVSNRRSEDTKIQTVLGQFPEDYRVPSISSYYHSWQFGDRISESGAQSSNSISSKSRVPSTTKPMREAVYSIMLIEIVHIVI